MTNSLDYNRILTSTSAAVDSAIVKYEAGDIDAALLELRNLGFTAGDIYRLINHPEQRRQYINDIISGF